MGHALEGYTWIVYSAAAIIVAAVAFLLVTRRRRKLVVAGHDAAVVDRERATDGPPASRHSFFISYRRDDSAPYAGRLYDHLAARFGAECLFMDIDTIRPGDDFVQAISDRVASCDVLIALIGKQWLNITDADGRRRLDNPNDFVRIEISSALARNVRVIPALVDGARMPSSHDLPDDLAPLSRRNAIEITNTMFRQSMARLIQVIEETIGIGPPPPP